MRKMKKTIKGAKSQTEAPSIHSVTSDGETDSDEIVLFISSTFPLDSINSTSYPLYV